MCLSLYINIITKQNTYPPKTYELRACMLNSYIRNYIHIRMYACTYMCGFVRLIRSINIKWYRFGAYLHAYINIYLQRSG